jgi:hypothetical protein
MILYLLRAVLQNPCEPPQNATPPSKTFILITGMICRVSPRPPLLIRSDKPTNGNVSLPRIFHVDIPVKTAQLCLHSSYTSALKTHPDRLPKGHTPAEKKRATEKFQAVADANYVLSDPVRRRDYDNLARQRGGFGAGSSSSKAGGFGGGYQQQQQSSSSQAPPGAFPEFNFADFMNNMNNARKSRRAQQTAEEEEEEEEEEDEYEQDNADKASGNFFKTFAGMFGMGGGGAGEKEKTDGGRPDANKMFGDVFEDM